MVNRIQPVAGLFPWRSLSLFSFASSLQCDGKETVKREREIAREREEDGK